MIIGLDLDGTLVDYNRLFLHLAMEKGLVSSEMPAHKVDIRNTIQQQHGDRAWQRLQALAYGERMSEACVFDGVFDALVRWQHDGHTVCIVSHKSQYTALLGEKGPNLHHHASACLQKWGFEDFIPPQNIHFCPTRRDKCLHIARLGCQVFVDDLPELLGDQDFPATVQGILFSPDEARTTIQAPYLLCKSWGDVQKAIARFCATHE